MDKKLNNLPIKYIFLAFLCLFGSFFSKAEGRIVRNRNAAIMADTFNPEKVSDAFDPGKLIMDHITDNHEWHFFSLKNEDGSYRLVSLPLPIILYSPTHGLSIFSYSRFEENNWVYKGYRWFPRTHVLATLDGTSFYDFSITKNVLQILISVTLLFLIFLSVANRYKKNSLAAPSGFQNMIETIIIFVRDEIAKPMLGDKANKYLPYLLTVFFFIWINNLLGLVPGSANVTGNIAVTTTLALFTFIITMFSSKRYYWSHLVNPPGVPGWVKFILVPVEVLSIFTKPFALLIRLFANMTAGHLIVLSFLCLIFIFAKMSMMAGWGVSVFSIAFSIFIYFLELLVAALQAYIFTILSALFISEAAADGHSHAEDHH